MTFVDTSALLAILDRRDPRNLEAVALWNQLLDSGEELFTTNYVIVETAALLQNRLGFEAARGLLNDAMAVSAARWIDGGLHQEAVESYLAAGRRKSSLVDCASFAAMHEAGCRRAFAFDKHFQEAGFELLRYGRESN